MADNLAEKLIERNRVGALLRIFAAKPEHVDYVVASGLSALRRLLSSRTGDRPTFARIDFLVSSDPQYDDTDCGETAERLRKAIATEFTNAPVNVLEIKRGDIYCMLLNYGAAIQLEDRVTYSLVLSHGAASYATEENIEAMLTALYLRARVVGVAIDEVGELVRKGRVLNTCAMWHNKSLIAVGGFDFLAAKPTRAKTVTHEMIEAWSEEKATRHGDGQVKYHLAGCEEIIPLVRLVRYFGPSIAVVEPRGEGLKWDAYDELVDKETYHRHLAKLATKEHRQQRMAATQGVGLEFIEEGVLKL
jgi:hypothetical protein